MKQTFGDFFASIKLLYSSVLFLVFAQLLRYLQANNIFGQFWRIISLVFQPLLTFILVYSIYQIAYIVLLNLVRLEHISLHAYFSHLILILVASCMACLLIFYQPWDHLHGPFWWLAAVHGCSNTYIILMARGTTWRSCTWSRFLTLCSRCLKLIWTKAWPHFDKAQTVYIKCNRDSVFSSRIYWGFLLMRFWRSIATKRAKEPKNPRPGRYDQLNSLDGFRWSFVVLASAIYCTYTVLYVWPDSLFVLLFLFALLFFSFSPILRSFGSCSSVAGLGFAEGRIVPI